MDHIMELAFEPALEPPALEPTSEPTLEPTLSPPQLVSIYLVVYKFRTMFNHVHIINLGQQKLIQGYEICHVECCLMTINTQHWLFSLM